jgi:hypothetical protein
MLCNFLFLCFFSKSFELRGICTTALGRKPCFPFHKLFVICYFMYVFLLLLLDFSSLIRILAFGVACGLISLWYEKKEKNYLFSNDYFFADLIILFYTHEKMASAA